MPTFNVAMVAIVLKCFTLIHSIDIGFRVRTVAIESVSNGIMDSLNK